MRPEPVFYPVVCLITGSTPRGGGVWKDILHGHPRGLLRRDPPLPLMTSALHFLDFRVSPPALRRWREKPLRQHYAFSEDGRPPPRWAGELFVDSGGFALILDPDLDLSPYGIPSRRLAEGILQLQLDLGADRIASLDWPIPPGLAPEEARRRMRRTLEAAVRTGWALAELPPHRRPRWMVPIHGPSPEAAADFARSVLQRLEAEGLLPLVSGLAVGSMVPRRRNGWVGEILAFVRAVRRAAPDGMPLHVFGMTGSIIPFLLREGATSFDSAGYIQNARHLQYVDPETRRLRTLQELAEERRYPCDCPICQGRDPRADWAVLRGKRPGRKSAVYAALALHNLEMDLLLFREALEALRAGSLDAFLQDLPRRFPTLRWPEVDRKAPKGFPIVRPHTPDDFDLRKREWRPAPGKEILLILPCSKEKPYTASRSFRRLWKKVEEELRGQEKRIQVVFLSGLYGPVPLEMAEEEAVTTYDFRLHPADAEGIARAAGRLEAMLHRVGSGFRGMAAFMPSPAYREAARRAARSFPELVIFGSRKELPELLQWLHQQVKEAR